MTEYEEKTATCRKAEFVFNGESSFALYLDFGFDEYHGTSFYITDYGQVEEIRKSINKNKTGLSKDMLNNNNLKDLVGRSARIQSAGIGTKCIFNGFMESKN